MHLERLTSILEIVGQKGQANVAEICAHTDLPRPSAYRLVQDLTNAGLLETTTRGQFTIGARLKRITQNDHSDQFLLDVVRPALKQAADQYGVAIFLSRLRGKSVEIIHVETPDTGVSYLHPGLGKRPLHACSCSKVVAATSPMSLPMADIANRLKAYTDVTLTKIEDLETEFQTIRAQGYAECVEEIERGMCSVAAVLGVDGPGATLSVGAAGSVRVFTPDFRARMGAEMREFGHKLALRLGWSEAEADHRPVA